MKNRKIAAITGLSLLLMALVAGFSYGYVFQNIVDLNDPAETLNRIRRDSDLFLLGIIGWMIIFVLDVIVSFGLWDFFKLADKNLSKWTAIFRLIYSGLLAISIIPLGFALNESNATADQVMVHLLSFLRLWSIGLVIFGFHLVGLGMLSLKSKRIPKWLGLILILAGLSYTVIHGLKVSAPDHVDLITALEKGLMLPMTVSELGLAIFLFRKNRIKP